LRIVSVTVPAAGAGPLALQIREVPELPIVLYRPSTIPFVPGMVVVISTRRTVVTLLSSVTEADHV